MKVLFLNPPYFPRFSRESRSPCVAKSGTLYWPMFLAYAAGSVEADGNEIMLLDSPAMDIGLQDTLERVAGFAPEVVILECSTPSISNDLMVAREVKRRTGCRIAMMGTHATALPEEVLAREPAVDFVIVGEADLTARELVRHLRGDGEVQAADVTGLAWRSETGPRRNAPRPPVEDLDALPWVSQVYHRHLRSCYRRYFYGANLNPLIVILTGRGCPHHCTYCVVPQTITGHRYRRRSVRDVVDELEWIYANFEEVGEVFFEDDTFTADQKRAQELSEEIVRRELHITWSVNARADVKYEVLAAMKRAGCRELCVGFESASQEVLQNIRKGVQQQNHQRFIRDADRAGLLVHGCFMVGNAGDTPVTLQQTLDLAKELNPTTAQFYPIMVYPGTEAFAEARARGELVSENWDDWLDATGSHNTTVVRPGLSTQQLVDFCDRARREFYLRPRYFLKAALTALHDRRERYRIFRGAWNLSKHLFRRHGKVAATGG